MCKREIKEDEMTVFKDFIQKMSEISGLELAATPNDACMLETDGLIVTLQYRSDHDDIVFFTPLLDPEKFIKIEEQILREALRLSFAGEKIGKCHLGLFDENLVLTKGLKIEGLTAEKLFLELNNFTDIALMCRDVLIQADRAARFSESQSSSIVHYDLNGISMMIQSI